MTNDILKLIAKIAYKRWWLIIRFIFYKDFAPDGA